MLSHYSTFIDFKMATPSKQPKLELKGFYKFKELVDTKVVDDKVIKDIRMSILMILAWIKANNIPMKNIFQVLCMESKKRNCVLFTGIPNGGKSLLTSILTSLYKKCTLGMISPLAMDSAFLFQGLINTSIYIIEEIKVGPGNVEAFKLLCEGSNYLKISIKNKPDVFLPKRPVIWCCNTLPWINHGGYAAPFNVRCLHQIFTTEAPKNFDTIYELDIDEKQHLCWFLYQYCYLENTDVIKMLG